MAATVGAEVPERTTVRLPGVARLVVGIVAVIEVGLAITFAVVSWPVGLVGSAVALVVAGYLLWVTGARTTFTAEAVTIRERRARRVPLGEAHGFYDAPRGRYKHSIWLRTDGDPVPVVTSTRPKRRSTHLDALNQVLARYQAAS